MAMANGNMNNEGNSSGPGQETKKLEVLRNLSNYMKETERRQPITFSEFLNIAAAQPQIVFRDVFQLFHDMIHHYVPDAVDDYRTSDESVGFINYNTSNLFQTECDNPFFADRLFANRIMALAEAFRKGTQNNYIYLFEGPPGSGKSTFLNNLLFKLEEYSKTPAGATYKVYWKLDVEALGGFRGIEFKSHGFMGNNNSMTDSGNDDETYQSSQQMHYPERFLEFSCPNHDHPVLMIPKNYRKSFLDDLIPDLEFKEMLFNNKEYEWVMKDVPCHICSSIFKSLLNRVKDPIDVFNMINVRRNYYNRQFGEGISIFNPGDALFTKTIRNNSLESMINDLLRDDDVRFSTSYLTKTNNGVLALMDIKEYNVERLRTYHGIISDGVHKVDLTEEYIKTLFVGLVNPEDKIHYEKVKSFQDRIITFNIPYVLDFHTEVAIYKSNFGESIWKSFLPRVLDNFAKIIISSRLETESPAIKRWLEDQAKYSKYLDKNFLLLKMDIYTGKVPTWLSDNDVRRFDKLTRRSVLAESEKEGNKGFSGRQSLNIFNQFFAIYGGKENLITMENVRKFFTDSAAFMKFIPEGFIDSLVDLYDYNVLQEVKESIYHYHNEQISRDIQNYLFAINFEPGETKKCPYTGDWVEISEDYFRNFETLFLGPKTGQAERKNFREDARMEYVTRTLAHDIQVEEKQLTESDQYINLFGKFTRILKENALTPYIENDNFRRAINDYGTESFAAYDYRMKRDIELLIGGLARKFRYTQNGAKEVALYVIDKKLHAKYK